MNYFIQIEGESHGPFTEEQIRSRLSDTSLKRSDLVCREDNLKWMPLGSLPEFDEAAQSPPALDNPMAVASLILGIISVGLLFAGVVLFLLTAVLSIILGHLATRKIRRSFCDVKGRYVAQVGLSLGYFGVLATFAVPTFSKTCAKGNQTKAISNCRQIITTLRLYSSDHDGKYPDGVYPGVKTSNEAFRLMIVDGQADNEMIFGCPASLLGNPDGNIGHAPDFLEALKPGENHWAMTKGLNDGDSGSYPLVFENPAEASWPPKWSPNLAGTGKSGRTWSGGKIIIGMNDSSVSTQKLESDKGDRVGLKLNQDGKDLFSQNERVLSVLDVARPPPTSAAR